MALKLPLEIQIAVACGSFHHLRFSIFTFKFNTFPLGY